MWAITQSGRWPGNEAIGMHVIYSESEEAAASSASMLGTLMTIQHFVVPYQHSKNITTYILKVRLDCLTCTSRRTIDSINSIRSQIGPHADL